MIKQITILKNVNFVHRIIKTKNKNRIQINTNKNMIISQNKDHKILLQVNFLIKASK